MQNTSKKTLEPEAKWTRERILRKKIKDTAKSFYNYMELFLCRTSRLAKDNTRGRIIIFPHYLEKIQMNAVLSQGDDQISHSSSKAVTTEIAHLKNPNPSATQYLQVLKLL